MQNNLTKNRNFSNSRWRTDAILKIVFWQYLGAILANLCNFRNGDEESHADISRLTKMTIFANSKWRTAAILKIALSPYLSRELSDFDQIWYAYANFHSEDGYLTKMKIFQIQDGGLTPYWKSFFGYISAPYWPINAKFGTEMKDNMPMYYQWPKLQFS